MPTLVNGKVTYSSGEALPNVGSSAYVAAQNGEINPKNSLTGGTPAPIGTTITSDSLSTVNPVVVPSPASVTPSSTPTLPPPNGSVVDSNGNVTAPPNPTPAPKTARQQLADEIQAQQGILDTKGTVQAQLQDDTQLQAKRDAARSSFNSYNQAKLALQQQVDSMKSQSGGTTQGNADAINETLRKGNSNLSNLALQAQVDQGLYADAQQTIKDKLDAQFAPVQAKIDNLYRFAEFNDNDPEVKAAAKKLETDNTNVQKVSTDLHQAVLDNGGDTATLSALDKISNDFISGKINATQAQNQMYAAAGKLGGDALKQVQIQKAKVDLAKAEIELKNIKDPSPVIADYSGFLQSRTPEQILKFNSLPENDKSAIAQLVNGDALLSDLIKNRGSQGTKDVNRYIQEATAIDPTFSVNTNKIRFAFNQKWNDPNGKSSVTRNALNTALGHLADFKMNADALDSVALKKLNSVNNILSTETGDPKVLRLRTDINALATEIAAAYKGTQPTEGEIKNWEETIAADFSKQQFSGVSDEIAKLLSSKITASRYQFKNTMGYEYGQSIIDPEKKQALLSAGISPDVFPFENTGNPADNPFGQATGGTNDYYDPSTGTFTIPK